MKGMINGIAPQLMISKMKRILYAEGGTLSGRHFRKELKYERA